MKSPVMAALMALAVLGLTAGGPVRAQDESKADEGKLNAEFDKRLFGGEISKDKKSYVCFVRKYDAAHLSKHPHQKVSAMTLLVRAEIDAEDGRVQHSFRLGVKYRGQSSKYHSAGSCGHSDISEAKDGQPRLGCGVDCDGGGLSVEMASGDKSVVVKLERIALWKTTTKPEEDDGERTSLTSGDDDAVFRLDRAPLQQCKHLVTDEEELAAMLPK